MPAKNQRERLIQSILNAHNTQDVTIHLFNSYRLMLTKIQAKQINISFESVFFECMFIVVMAIRYRHRSFSSLCGGLMFLCERDNLFIEHLINYGIFKPMLSQWVIGNS